MISTTAKNTFTTSQTVSMKPLRAQKLPQYVLEPIKTGYSRKWEGHHTTNPCVVRFAGDNRIFLGYRAGGYDDYYFANPWDVWASHLGLAILGTDGTTVEHRLPLPIMTIERKIPLPQNMDQYQEFVKTHKDDILMLHDFRFLNYRGYLHVIFHEASVADVYDSIMRMPTETFLSKIEKSLELMRQPVESIIDQWRELWWKPGVWEPCGVNGTNRIFASNVVKGDIIFFELADGTLQMCHRPLCDGMAVVNVGTEPYAKATPDGFTMYGTYETCIRPGYLDNSHLGNNGMPTRARIGNSEVYIDVTHGCHDRIISEIGEVKRHIHYYPYFRVKSYETGELLYYSTEPILDFCEIWREYAEHGEWISANSIYGGIMFSGGQIELVQGKNGLDDDFVTYIGLGDTAVGAAMFKLRDLLPDNVIEDISGRKEHHSFEPVGQIRQNASRLDRDVNGWQWSISNDLEERHIHVIRALNINGEAEVGIRSINTVPGNFDADCMIFDGKMIRFLDKIGWAIIYKGIRWTENNGHKTSSIGYGVLLLDKHNPEKVLFHSDQPIEGRLYTEPGWTYGGDYLDCGKFLENVTDHVPAKVIAHIQRIGELTEKKVLFPSQMVIWQKQKSGQLGRNFSYSLMSNLEGES
jgi:hypothetical protein